MHRSLTQLGFFGIQCNRLLECNFFSGICLIRTWNKGKSLSSCASWSKMTWKYAENEQLSTNEPSSQSKSLHFVEIKMLSVHWIEAVFVLFLKYRNFIWTYINRISTICESDSMNSMRWMMNMIIHCWKFRLKKPLQIFKLNERILYKRMILLCVFLAHFVGIARLNSCENDNLSTRKTFSISNGCYGHARATE